MINNYLKLIKDMIVETFEQYIKVTAEEGFYISSYKEGDDILSYSSCTLMFAPLGTDLSNLSEITEEENNRYLALQLAKIKEEEENGR